jgi:hypothetical protein
MVMLRETGGDEHATINALLEHGGLPAHLQGDVALLPPTSPKPASAPASASAPVAAALPTAAAVAAAVDAAAKSAVKELLLPAQVPKDFVFGF